MHTFALRRHGGLAFRDPPIGGEQLAIAAIKRGDGLSRQEADLNRARLCVACLRCYWRLCFVMRLMNIGRLDVRRKAVRSSDNGG